MARLAVFAVCVSAGVLPGFVKQKTARWGPCPAWRDVVSYRAGRRVGQTLPDATAGPAWRGVVSCRVGRRVGQTLPGTTARPA